MNKSCSVKMKGSLTDEGSEVLLSAGCLWLQPAKSVTSVADACHNRGIAEGSLWRVDAVGRWEGDSNLSLGK